MAKELIKVKGVELTENVNKVYECIMNSNKAMNYKEVAHECGIKEKTAIGTLARLDSVHGLIKKNEPVKGTFYKVNQEKMESADLSKITDKERKVLDTFKDIQGEFSYKDIQVENMTSKAVIATLARFNTTYGVLDKDTLKGIATYEKKGE